MKDTPLVITEQDVGRRVRALLVDGHIKTGVVTYQGGMSAYVCIDGDDYSRTISKFRLEWENAT